MNLSRYIGLPYSDLDCWALVRAVYRDEFNIQLPELPIQMEEKYNWIEVEPGSERPGDLLLFRMKKLKRHVALVVGDGRMLHSDEENGVVAERYRRDMWKTRLQTIYRRA